MGESQTVMLSRMQAKCLDALRMGSASLSKIAATAGVSRKSASVALSGLEVRGLAERIAGRRWRPTRLGEACRVSVAVRRRSLQNRAEPSANGRRLLDLLERPTEGLTIAKKLDLSRQGALNVMRRLQEQGYLKFADPENPSWWVMRADDPTPLLTREQERVLSATPGDYATDARKIRLRAKLPEDRTEAALDVLMDSGFVEAAGEFNGAALFRATAAGVGHPQNRPNIREAKPTRLPVKSDRVRVFLSAIQDAGALRIKQLKESLGWSFPATNALMQYLKKRGLVRKSDETFEAPYVLTPLGSLTLAEMAKPGQMKSGYSPGAMKATAQPGATSPRQRPKKAKLEKPPRLPVHSDRVHAVLSALAEGGALRIKQVSDTLGLPLQSTNSLMQYLKGKALVQKTGEGLGAPYALTSLGKLTLTQMEQQRAA